MTWLSTPETLRQPPTLDEFRDLWRVSERKLARYHATHGFVEAIIRCMMPWLARIHDIRLAIYKNATDPARKDQRAWILDYEQMLVNAVGDRGRILTTPPKEEKRDRTRIEPSGRADRDGDPEGVIHVS